MAKRIQVPVSDETLAHLEYTSKLTGRSLAALCADVVEETAPVLRQMADAFRLAKMAPARAMREALEVAEQKVAELDQLKLELTSKATGEKKKAG